MITDKVLPFRQYMLTDFLLLDTFGSSCLWINWIIKLSHIEDFYSKRNKFKFYNNEVSNMSKNVSHESIPMSNILYHNPIYNKISILFSIAIILITFLQTFYFTDSYPSIFQTISTCSLNKLD